MRVIVLLITADQFMLYLLYAGLLSWDVTSCHVDLAKELDTITSASPPGEESRGGNEIFKITYLL